MSNVGLLAEQARILDIQIQYLATMQTRKLCYRKDDRAMRAI